MQHRRNVYLPLVSPVMVHSLFVMITIHTFPPIMLFLARGITWFGRRHDKKKTVFFNTGPGFRSTSERWLVECSGCHRWQTRTPNLKSLLTSWAHDSFHFSLHLIRMEWAVKGLNGDRGWESYWGPDGSERSEDVGSITGKKFMWLGCIRFILTTY